VEAAKQFLTEVFGARTGKVEESRLEECKDGQWAATFSLGE
jgi:hypothetical protein